MSKLNPTTLSEDTFEAVPAENLYYNTVAATSDESAAPYDQVPPAVVSNEFSEKETFATLKLEGNSNKENDQDKRKRATHMCLPACFILLIIAVTASAVAVAIAFVLIAGLRSDLTAVLKDLSLRYGSASDNEKKFYVEIGIFNTPVE